jgi:UDP-glucose 4-epimerase
LTGVVLVTGVSRHLGGRLATLLGSDPAISRVVGVDLLPPREPLRGVEFVRADIRTPAIAKVIAGHGVDTVVHMNVIATPLAAGGRSTMKEINVIGTMQLLAACQRAPRLRKLVVKSTSAVYGASPKDPALCTEDTEPHAPPRRGWPKDSAEVEGYVRGFARRRPDVAVSVLRLANVIGPEVETAMTSYLSLPAIPSVAGFDPRLQFVHEQDALEALRLATAADVPGTFNVAGDGVLLLSQAARIAGRPLVPVPAPLVGWLGRGPGRSRLADFSPEQVRYLSYGRCLDTTRMREVLGLEPAWTTRSAVEDFVRARRLGSVLGPETVTAVEQRLRLLLPRAGGVDA